jgi:hypothetical protein
MTCPGFLIHNPVFPDPAHPSPACLLRSQFARAIGARASQNAKCKTPKIKGENRGDHVTINRAGFVLVRRLEFSFWATRTVPGASEPCVVQKARRRMDFDKPESQGLARVAYGAAPVPISQRTFSVSGEDQEE